MGLSPAGQLPAGWPMGPMGPTWDPMGFPWGPWDALDPKGLQGRPLGEDVPIGSVVEAIYREWYLSKIETAIYTPAPISSPTVGQCSNPTAILQPCSLVAG